MKRIYSFLIAFLLLIIPKVNACELTYEEYSDKDIKISMVVGEYVFDIYEGYSPSLEDIAIASRTIPEGEEEYVYNIVNYGTYFVLDILSDEFSNDRGEFPKIDVTYQYRDNIRGASKEDYDIFTCQVDWINVNYTTLETIGEKEYKTSATRTINITSDKGLEEVKYCITAGDECVPNQDGVVESGLMKINYETAVGGQRICVEAKDPMGNTSGIVCDKSLVKVDEYGVKVSETDKLAQIKEKEPHSLDDLFSIEFSVSGGDLTYYYYTGSETEGNRTKHLLSNLADLPNGLIDIEVRAIGGNGLTANSSRQINVVKNLVTYDYQTNGGTSADITQYETVYKGKAKLNAKAVKEGYEFIGWNTDKNAKFGLDKLEVSEDTTLYAIFKKEVEANFELVSKKDAILATTEYQSMTCEMYNNESSCEVTVPMISAKMGYVALGWSDIEFATSVQYNGGEEISLSDDQTYYSVTHDKTATTATFTVYENGKIVEKVLSCYKYNGESSCEVDATDIVSEDYQGMTLAGFTDTLANMFSESFRDIRPVDSYVISSGKHYYAYYEHLYTIEYVSGMGQKTTDEVGVKFILDIESVKQKVDTGIVPEAEEMDGYTFLGYKTGLENGDIEISPGDTILVEKETTYNAIYEKEVTLTYTTVDDDVFGLPEPVTGKMYYLSGNNTEVGAEIKLDAANTVTKQDSIFKSWADDTQEYDAGEVITIYEDTELTPNWIIDGSRVIFNYWQNGGLSSTKSSMTYYRGEDPLNVTTVTARKPGWEFIGWSTNPEATGGPLGKEYTPEITGGDVELYAMFRKVITISFVSQDSEVLQTDTQAITGILYNNETTYPVRMRTVSVRTEFNGKYEFIKWSTNKDDTDQTTTGYAPNESINVSENTTFYTISKEIEPLVGRFYYMEDEEIQYVEETCQRFNGSSSCTLNKPTLTSEYKTGVLTGFNSDMESIELEEEYHIETNTDYYGVYERILSVRYHSGILSANDTVNLVNMHYLITPNDQVEFPAEIKLDQVDGVSGFTTLGWREDEEALEQTYYVGETLTINSDREFFGVYEKQITLSYNSMGGETTPPNQEKILRYNTVQDVDNVFTYFTLAEGVKRLGFEFLGWDAGNTGNVYQAGETIPLNKSTKMHAVWSGQSYKVTYDCKTNGGDTCSVTTAEAQVVYLNQVDLTPMATKEGWEFVGWSDKPNSDTILSEKEMSSVDIVLYAVFRQPIKANWIITDTSAGAFANGKTMTETTCYKYNNEEECRIETGNMIASSGYIVSGWTSEQGSLEVETANNNTTLINQDTDFYSITRRTNPLVATFYYGTEEDSITYVETSCQLYNGATTCSITSPLTPTMYKGAVFTRWSSDDTEVADINFEISENTSYYAQFIKPISITYHDGEYGNMITDSKTVEYITSDIGDNEIMPTFSIPVPESIDSYTTLGWTDDGENRSAGIVEVGGRDLTIDYSLELYGRYSREISLNYDPDGGTPEPSSETVTQQYHSALGATTHEFEVAEAISREGDNFDGWAVDGDTENVKEPGETIRISKTTTLVAIWE